MSESQKSPVKIALLGCGTVGGGVLRLLEDNREFLASRVGAELQVQHVLVRDLGKDRGKECKREWLTNDAEKIFNDPSVDLVVEVIGGETPARAYLERALKTGRSVVTANKYLISKHGPTLREALASDTVSSVHAILNGTCNYILTRMRQDGLSFGAALKEAQELGYAEADPTMDIEGQDAAQKLSVVSMLAFDTSIGTDAFLIEGIRDIEDIDFRFADRFGFTLKHLCIGHDRGDQVELRAHPALIPKNSVLANVDGVLNGVFLMGRALGPCLLVGRGAGDMPTAVSVVADIVDVASSRIHGESGLATRGIQIRSRQVMSPDQIETRYYLRFGVGDHPGVLGRIASALGSQGVSIEQMVQEGRASGTEDAVQVCILTHQTKEGAVRSAIASIEQQAILKTKARLIRIEDV